MTAQPINSKSLKAEVLLLSSDGDISIRIERDTQKIKHLILCEDLKEHLLSDQGKLIHEIRKYKTKGHFAYIMCEKGKDFGIVTLEYLQRLKLGIVEVGVIKDYRGLKAKKAIFLIIKHIYEKKPTIKLMARIKKDNRKGYFFSKLFGFRLKTDNGTHYIVTR